MHVSTAHDDAFVVSAVTNWTRQSGFQDRDLGIQSQLIHSGRRRGSAQISGGLLCQIIEFPCCFSSLPLGFVGAIYQSPNTSFSLLVLFNKFIVPGQHFLELCFGGGHSPCFFGARHSLQSQVFIQQRKLLFQFADAPVQSQALFDKSLAFVARLAASAKLPALFQRLLQNVPFGRKLLRHFAS
jgi:hypothetical protein